jgi:hypothetical protein
MVCPYARGALRIKTRSKLSPHLPHARGDARRVGIDGCRDGPPAPSARGRCHDVPIWNIAVPTCPTRAGTRPSPSCRSAGAIRRPGNFHRRDFQRNETLKLGKKNPRMRGTPVRGQTPCRHSMPPPYAERKAFAFAVFRLAPRVRGHMPPILRASASPAIEEGRGLTDAAYQMPEPIGGRGAVVPGAVLLPEWAG